MVNLESVLININVHINGVDIPYSLRKYFAVLVIVSHTVRFFVNVSVSRTNCSPVMNM